MTGCGFRCSRDVGVSRRAVQIALCGAAAAFPEGFDAFFFGGQLGVDLPDGFFPSVPQFQHLAFQQEEIALGQQVQVALEGQVPVFRGPLPQVFQAVGDETQR